MKVRQIRGDSGTHSGEWEQSHQLDVLCEVCKSLLASAIVKALSVFQNPSDKQATIQEILKRCAPSCWLCLRMRPILQRISEDQSDNYKDKIEVDIKIVLSPKSRNYSVLLLIENIEYVVNSFYSEYTPTWQGKLRQNFTCYELRNKKPGVLEERPAPTLSLMEGPVQLLDDYVDYNPDETGNTEHLSELRLKTIQGWLDGCLESHANKCTRALKTEQFLPRRLIQISSRYGEARAALVESEAIEDKEAVRYATLSHCWGQNPFTTLTKTNFNTFHLEIDLSSLGRTFREAIYLCHDLRLNYLWIDSLCIIQDSDAGIDWIQQAPIMHQVYEASTLNIVAAASSACAEGLIHRLSTAWFRELEISIEPHALSKRVLLTDDSNKSFGNWAKLPVFQRGWCIQELFLAPRNIYFSDTQLYWSCSTDSGGEMATHRWRPSLESTLRCVYRSAMADGKWLKEPSLDDQWNRIASDYATTTVTVKIDRLYALAGIAAWFYKRYSEAGTKTEYLLGLWLHKFPTNLLWRTHPSLPTNDCHSEDLTMDPSVNPVLPSWSWLSSSSMEFFREDWKPISTAYLSLQRNEIEFLLPELPFGPVRSARLLVRAPLYIFKLTRLPQPLPSEEDAHLKSPSIDGTRFRFPIPADCVSIHLANGSELTIPQEHCIKAFPIRRLIVKVYYDHASSTEAPFPRNVAFIPVVRGQAPGIEDEFEGTETLHGLVIEATTDEIPGWRRLGTMMISDRSEYIDSENFDDRHWVDDLDGLKSNGSREFFSYLTENMEYHDFHLV